MCASMCPCFHHFLLFSAKKKWDCTSGDFYSFSHFVIHDGILLGLSRAHRKRHRRHGGFGKATEHLAACRRVHGLPCLRIAKLCYSSGSPATAEKGEGYRRFVCKLQRHYTCLKNACCLLRGYKLWAERDRTYILQNLSMWFFPFPSPKFTACTVWQEILLIFIFLQNYDVLCSWSFYR